MRGQFCISTSETLKLGNQNVKKESFSYKISEKFNPVNAKYVLTYKKKMFDYLIFISQKTRFQENNFFTFFWRSSGCFFILKVI